MDINFDRDKWIKIFDQFHMSTIVPSSEAEWTSFFQNAIASKNPLKYDNIRQSLIFGLYEDNITPGNVRLLCDGLETLLDLSTKDYDKLKKVYDSYVENFKHIIKKRPGINVIRMQDGHDPFLFATNSVVRYLLWSF